MENNKTQEILLTQFINSSAVKKIAFLVIIIGIILCFILQLPFIQNKIYIVINENFSYDQDSDKLASRLPSLLSLSLFGLLICIFFLCCLYSKEIINFFENEKYKTLIISAASGFIIILLFFISIFSYYNGWQWLDSDHSSEMILGSILAQENTFISSNWYYSTEIRMIYQTLFSMPFFKFLGGTSNWALIRALVILCNNIILLISYFFMMKQMKVSVNWILITGVFLLLPLSIEYWNIVLFGGYYVFFIAQLFCIIGLFTRLSGYTDLKKNQIVDFFLFTLLTFLLGMQGIRSLFSVYFPLLITCIYLRIKIKKKKNYPLFLGCYSFIVCCFGFLVNYYLLLKYKFYSFDNIQLTDLKDEFLIKFGQCVISIAEFFGFSAKNSILSVSGILSIITLIGTVFLFRAFVKLYNRTQLPEHKYLVLYFFVSIIFNIFIFIIADQRVISRYFIPFMVLYVPLIAFLFNQIKIFNYVKRVAVIAAVILYIFGQSYVNFQNLAVININTVRKGYIQYLSDNNLLYGFATFWNANVTTELSNGKIKMTGLYSRSLMSDEQKFGIHYWLMPVQYKDPLYYRGESFLLVSRAEWEYARNEKRSFTMLHPDFEDNNYIIIRYPSAKVIHDEVLDK